MNTVTIDQVMSFRPCGYDKDDDGKHYTRNRVTQLFAGRDGVTAMDVLTCADVPDEDKLWLVLRTEFMPEMMIHELACDFASSVMWIVEKHTPGEKRPQNAIDVKRRWIRGEATDEELDAAWDAAWDAARDAARAAARDAAWDAARDAARAAQIEMVRAVLIKEDRP